MKNKLIFGLVTTVAVAAGLALVKWYSSKDVKIDAEDYFTDEPEGECCEESCGC